MKTKTETCAYGDTNPSQVIITETAPHSVELSCNAKGQYSWSIKVYFKDEEKDGIVDAVEKINDQMKVKFPNIDDLAKLTELDKKAKKS